MTTQSNPSTGLRRSTFAFKPSDAAPDWLTCTATTKGLGEPLWALGDALLVEDQTKGEQPTRWQMKGYRGWSTLGCRIGVRSDGVLLSLSGLKCRENSQKALATSEHCSRLDLAVDVHSALEMTSVPQNLYRYLNHVPPRNGRPVKRTLITNSDGGATLYIGSRTSDWFTRIYDKGIEQKAAPPGHWLRFELEIKGRAADGVAAALQRAASVQHFSLSVVARRLQLVAGIVMYHKYDSVMYHEPPRATSIDRKLRWLSVTVRPTVQVLVEELGVRKVAHALGLPQSALRDHEEPLK